MNVTIVFVLFGVVANGKMSCHGNEFADSVAGEDFLSYLIDHRHLKNNCLSSIDGGVFQ
jgi:hypothetical protein